MGKTVLNPFFSDAHIHVTPSLLPFLKDIFCIANADNPEEYLWLTKNKLPGMTISAGIHPWKAANTSWSGMEPILRTCTVIGEIGLDGVWCDTDINIQRDVFRRQLLLAHTLGKPVILHTKGMEGEILQTIRQYPNRYLIHWYSCQDFLYEYMDLDCWFTAGPDLRSNSCVQRLAKKVPLNRLLLESDGLEGLIWGQSRPLIPSDYPQIMGQQMQALALLRNISVDLLASQMSENLNAFLF